MKLLKINRLLPIYISIVPLKFEVDIQSQSKVRVRKPKNPIWRPLWKWHRWKSIGFCLWPPSTCIWNLKLKFQSKLDVCSGNHVVYRQTDRRDGRTNKVNPVYPPPTSLGGGIIINMLDPQSHHIPQPKRSSSSGTHNMIPPWNIHTVKQSMPRSCSNGCSLNWFTPSEFFKFSQLTN